MSFSEKIISASGGKVRLITGIENSQPVWFYLLLSPETYPEYERQIKKGSMDDIRKYGKVLFQGIGEEPPAIIRQVIVERYPA